MKKQKPYQSGFCRHSKLHHLCHEVFETPSVILVCDCGCHQDKVAKVKRRVIAKTMPSRKIVAKS